MKNTAKRKGALVKKAIRIIGIIAVVGLIFSGIIASMTIKPSNAELVWDEQMTLGNLDAKNHFIIYSDLVCPYCIAFENAIVENEEEFQKYLEENDILYEVRLSDFLYEYGEAQAISSRHSALATYCAKKEGKFWDYYNRAITSVWNDYFKSMGKSAFSRLNNASTEYWINIGKQIGLGEEFESCVEKEEPLDEIKKNAEKTSRLANGMPYFKLNNYTSSGFDLGWGWEYVKMYFEAGLNS